MNYFDKMASEWDAERKRVELASCIGDAIVNAIAFPSDSRVMDYGSGTGLLTLKLQSYCGTITAVDTSSKMLEVLSDKITRSKLPNVETLLWNIETDAILSESFDVIASSMVMHHLKNTQGVLDRFFMMLKEEGRVALADLDAEEGDFHSPDSPFFHNGFKREYFSNCLSKAGFQNIRFSTPTVVTKPTVDGVMKDYPIFLVIAEK